LAQFNGDFYFEKLIKMKFIPILLLIFGISFATTIQVPGNFSTIQAGINATIDGDTVLVQPGEYFENINYFGKAILLTSTHLLSNNDDDIRSTIINGNNTGSVVRFNNEEGSSSIIHGFTLTNGNTYNGGGIYCSGSSPTIRYVTITGNHAIYNGGGVIAYFNSHPKLISVTVYDNTADGNAGGIYLWESQITLVNSILWDNPPHEVYCNISGAFNTVTVAYSDIEGGMNGIFTNSNGSIIWQSGNINSDPFFRDIETGDLQLTYGSPCIDSGTTYYSTDGNVLVNLMPEDYDGIGPDMGGYEFHSIYGCTDENAFNYNPDATIDDDSCEYLWGCTDSNAANFDPDAFYDDGTCEYAPQLLPIQNQSINEDTSLEIFLFAEDIDSEQIYFSATSDTLFVSVSVTTDLLMIVPDANWFGTAHITVAVTDGVYSDEQVFTLVVLPIADPPELINPGDQEIYENQQVSIILDAVDNDNELIYFSAQTDTNAIAISVQGDTLNMTPAPQWYGSATITVAVSDGLYQNQQEFILSVLSAFDDVNLGFGELWMDSLKVEVSISSETDISGFQLQITGDNLTIDRIRGGWVDEYGFVMQFNPETQIIIGFSPLGDVLPANPDGILFNLYFDGWGDPELCLNNVVITRPNGTEANVIPGECVLIDFPLGDVTNDGSIDILDVVSLVSIVLSGGNGSPYQFWAGDLNSDGEINITDIVNMVQIILNQDF